MFSIWFSETWAASRKTLRNWQEMLRLEAWRAGAGTRTLKTKCHRRPPAGETETLWEVWNTVLFFPPISPRPGKKSHDDTLDLDLTQSPTESEFESLSFYFDKAVQSIQVCALLLSEFELVSIVRRKRNSGLLIQVIADHDTLAERNGSRYLRKIGKTHSNSTIVNWTWNFIQG